MFYSKTLMILIMGVDEKMKKTKKDDEMIHSNDLDDVQILALLVVLLARHWKQKQIHLYHHHDHHHLFFLFLNNSNVSFTDMLVMSS